MSRQVKQISAMRGLLLLAILTGFSPLVWGQEPLPSPLSLAQALAIAEQDHPERLLADAALAQALASRQRVRSTYDTQLSLTGELRAIEPSEIAIYQNHNDSLARLNLSKQLYDFGRTARAEEAADASLVSSKWRLKSVRQQRRLEVMQRFFAVLLADLKHARDNEALAIAFIRFDRASNRHEMGKVSDVELLELESQYQQVRRELVVSANQQRITRSQLAISLNRPTDLPAELEMPEIGLEQLGEEFELWVEKTLSGNLEMKALRGERYKSILTIEGDVVAAQGRSHVPEDAPQELYDLGEDPAELHDLMGTGAPGSAERRCTLRPARVAVSTTSEIRSR